ncbi:Protein of unknown function [Pyronema omphalodes CBS 100304]|uniref:Uncharacterized protein n=1 Tax=Pyronema omphalodes (strain CBS 100304) TaxID=1076935 RepID=U4LS98_PYROM|nr:Protein of unknown function [Pyronema omphalodes CBS 100304]
MLSTLASNLGISGNDSSYSRDKPTQTRQPSRIPTRNSSYTRGEPYRDSFSRAPAYIRGSSFRDREVSRGRRIERAVDRIASPITKTTCGIGLMVDGATQTSGDVVERGVVKSEGLMGAQAQAQSEKATHASLASGIPTCGSCAGTGVDRDFNPQIHLSPASAAHHAATTHTPVRVWTPPTSIAAAASAAASLAHASRESGGNGCISHHGSQTNSRLGSPAPGRPVTSSGIGNDSWPLQSALHAHTTATRRRRADSEPPVPNTAKFGSAFVISGPSNGPRKRDSGFISGAEDEVTKGDVVHAAAVSMARGRRGSLTPIESKENSPGRSYHGTVHDAARLRAEERLARIGYRPTGLEMDLGLTKAEERRRKGQQAQMLLLQAKKNVEERMARQDRELADKGLRRDFLPEDWVELAERRVERKRLARRSSDPSMTRSSNLTLRGRESSGALRGVDIDIGGGGAIDQEKLEIIAAQKVRENLRGIDERAAELEWERRRVVEEKERMQMARVREKEMRREEKRERKARKKREKMMNEGSSLSSMSSMSMSTIGSNKEKKLGLFRRGSRKSATRNSSFSSSSSGSSNHQHAIMEPAGTRGRRFSANDASSTHRKSTFLSFLFGRNRHKSPHRKSTVSEVETHRTLHKTHKSSTNTPHRGSIGSVFFDHHTSEKKATMEPVDRNIAVEAANDPIQPLPAPPLSASRRSTDSSRSSHYHDTHETPQTLGPLPEAEEGEMVVETITETVRETKDSKGKVVKTETIVRRDVDMLDLPESAKLPEFGGEMRIQEMQEKRRKSVGFVEGDVTDTIPSPASSASSVSEAEEKDNENNPLGLPEFSKKKKKKNKTKGKNRAVAASTSTAAAQVAVPVENDYTLPELTGPSGGDPRSVAPVFNDDPVSRLPEFGGSRAVGVGKENELEYGQKNVVNEGARPVMREAVDPVAPKPVDPSTAYMGLPEFAGKSSTPTKESKGTLGFLDLPEFGGGSKDKGKGKEVDAPTPVVGEKSNFLSFPEFGANEMKRSLDSGRESKFTEGL